MSPLETSRPESSGEANLLEKVLPRLRKVLDEVNHLVDSLQFDSSDRQHVVTGALLGRILELEEGIYSNLERRDSGCGFILLRSTMEAYIDLLNTARDPEYPDFMEAAFVEQQERLLGRVLEKGSSSPFLSGLSGDKGAVDQLNWTRSRLKELKPLTVKQRFDRAGQLSYYDGPYAYLCWHSHNNSNILRNRHIRITESGFEINAFVPIDNDDLKLISDTTAAISANCVVASKELLAEETPARGLEELTEALSSLRELWH